MALSKKKSRPITVNDSDYRWQFFENSGWNDVTIQSAKGHGPKLVVQFAWDHKGPPFISFLPPVTPATVHQIIDQALVLGWDPEGQGSTFTMKWLDGKLSSLEG